MPGLQDLILMAGFNPTRPGVFPVRGKSEAEMAADARSAAADRQRRAVVRTQQMNAPISEVERHPDDYGWGQHDLADFLQKELSKQKSDDPLLNPIERQQQKDSFEADMRKIWLNQRRLYDEHAQRMRALGLEPQQYLEAPPTPYQPYSERNT